MGKGRKQSVIFPDALDATKERPVNSLTGRFFNGNNPIKNQHTLEWAWVRGGFLNKCAPRTITQTFSNNE